jgi:hypothetical protein
MHHIAFRQHAGRLPLAPELRNMFEPGPRSIDPHNHEGGSAAR